MAEFDNPLTLVSPHLRGKRVKDAQWLLAGHNHFSTTKNPVKPYTGRIDGIYGPDSALSTKKAKYWLGYANDAIDGHFGQHIYNILTNQVKLDKDELKRRNDRIAAVNTVPEKAIELARKEIGVKESPFGSNMQKYGAWYGMNGVPWCAIFISWCLSHAGWEWKQAYVPYIAGLAARGQEHCYLTRSPVKGDIVTYYTAYGRDMHIAFFDQWVNPGYLFYDIGGNTGPTNLSNGGEVARQLQNASGVSHFIHLR